jgi:hypothetical protein
MKQRLGAGVRSCRTPAQFALFGSLGQHSENEKMRGFQNLGIEKMSVVLCSPLPLSTGREIVCVEAHWTILVPGNSLRHR